MAKMGRKYIYLLCLIDFCLVVAFLCVVACCLNPWKVF
jgi:hypothetical protein